MTTLPPDPPDDNNDDDAIDWDNVVHVFEVLTRHTDASNPPPPPPPEPPTPGDLPDDDAIADFLSRVSDLEYADTDADKVVALKELTRWLAQWRF